MTIQEMEAFTGSPYEFEEYQVLLKKRDRISRKLGKLNEEIEWEKLSLSAFEGELNEKDKKLFQRHVNDRRALEIKIKQEWDKLELVIKRLNELTTREGGKR